MSTDSGAPRSAAPIHRTPPAAPPRAAVGPPGARSSSRASVSTQSGSRPGSSAGAAPYAHPRHGGAFNEGDECMEEEDPTARVTFEPEGGDQEAERGGRVGHPISAKASIRGAAHAAQATAPAAPPAATAEELLAEDLQQRLAAMFLARQGRSTAQRVGIVYAEPCRRPPGRRVVLHWTSGPRPRPMLDGGVYCPPSNAACFCSCAPPRYLSRALPQLPTATPALATLRRPFPPF